MGIKRTFLNLLKKLWHIPLPHKSKQNKTSISLKELANAGLKIKKVFKLNTKDKEKLVYASQLPANIVPWVAGMKSGTYLVKFRPKIQSQINSNFLNVTGGVARNKSGEIVAHGTNVNLLSLSPIILYQVGVVAFGACHLKKINESLKKIQKKLDKISSFLLDKRSAEISALLLELTHISKGIIEFSKSGNLREVLSRIDLIKHIRIMNLPHLLHLQKNLQDTLNALGALKKTSLIKRNKETKELTELVNGCQSIVLDYGCSLYLDILCTKVEVMFSMCHSFEEVKSRLSSQCHQMEFLKAQSLKFEKILNDKLLELLDSWIPKWIQDNTTSKERIRALWKKTKEIIPDIDTTYKKYAQFTKDKIESKDNVIYLKIGEETGLGRKEVKKFNQKKSRFNLAG